MWNLQKKNQRVKTAWLVKNPLRKNVNTIKLPWEHGIPEIEGEHMQQWYMM